MKTWKKAALASVVTLFFWQFIAEAHAMPWPDSIVPNLTIFFYLCAGITAMLLQMLLDQRS